MPTFGLTCQRIRGGALGFPPVIEYTNKNRTNNQGVDSVLENQPFCELAALSNFTFLEGASHPEEVIARAAQLRLGAVAIADPLLIEFLVHRNDQANLRLFRCCAR